MFDTVLNILNLITIITIGLLLKQYLPSYFSQKGKNLATKEDIADITNEIEKTRLQYANELEKLGSSGKFVGKAKKEGRGERKREME